MLSLHSLVGAPLISNRKCQYIKSMADELNFKQELTGCFVFPVAENPTQAMIEPAYAAMGLDWRYLTLEVRPENLAAAVAGARAFGLRSFTCTIPHKIEVIQHLDGLGMLVAQGVIGIEYWTGQTPDAGVMRGGLEAVFGA